MDFKNVSVNGKTYQSLNELPEPLRSLFKDADRNGIPDIFEGKLAGLKMAGMIKNAIVQKLIVQGKEYGSVAELPPEVREKLEAKLGKLENQSIPMDKLFGAAARSRAAQSQDYLNFYHQNPSSGFGKKLGWTVGILLAFLLTTAFIFFILLPQK